MNRRPVGVAVAAGVISFGIVGTLITGFTRPWTEVSATLGLLTGIAAGGLATTLVYLRVASDIPANRRSSVRAGTGLSAGLLVVLIARVLSLTIGFSFALTIVLLAVIVGGVLALGTALVGTLALRLTRWTREKVASSPDDTRLNNGQDYTGEESSGNSRRRVLKIAGGVGTASALGVTGWAGRTAHLFGKLDRTHLVDSSETGSRVSGADSESVPAASLLSELRQYSTQRSEVGLQASVIFDDSTTWLGTAGNASHREDVPVSFDTHLYVGSITKFFTATLALREVQRGTLSLDDQIDEWVDLDFAEEVTIRMLLNHTTGIPNYTENLWWGAQYFGRPTKRWQPDELVSVISDQVLKFESGSRYEYSNTNYVLLGVILERLTGVRYQALLRDLVREELGYEHTYYLGYPDDVPIANGYDESIFGLGRRNLTAFRQSLETGAYAAGGVLSTAPDVAGFLRSVFSGRVLDDETRAEMRTFVDAPDEDVPDQLGYGLGTRNLEIDGQSLVGHTGTIPGYSGIAMHHDEPAYTIAVLSNVSTIDQSRICGALQRVVLNEYY